MLPRYAAFHPGKRQKKNPPPVSCTARLGNATRGSLSSPFPWLQALSLPQRCNSLSPSLKRRSPATVSALLPSAAPPSSIFSHCCSPLSPSAAPLSRRFSLSVSLLPAHRVTGVQHAMPPSVAPTFLSLRPSELPSLAGLSRPALLPSLAGSLSLSPSFWRMPSSASSTPFRRPSHSPYWAQVIGWPPIRSFRKNSMAVNTPTDNEEKDCMYIKVSLDGAPYLRKVDLKTYGSYVELSTALEKMFSGFTIGQLGNHGAAGQDEFEPGRLADNLQRSEYVLTYEDKDRDWMLVGDVPWNMFMNSCQRLRIIKSSEAVGLGSGATEK